MAKQMSGKAPKKGTSSSAPAKSAGEGKFMPFKKGGSLKKGGKC
jgi:hypothetical protein